MESDWTLEGRGECALRLTRHRVRGAAPETVSPVLTVIDVSRRLRKSRRQVYRYLRAGRLTPCARVLGQWLFAPADVARMTRSRPPAAVRPFFWDVPLSSLDPDRHRDVILARLLEFGDQRALAWAFRRYPRKLVAAFLKGRGAELLSRRSWAFWASLFGARGRRAASKSWRVRGRHWGGLGS